MPDVTRNPGDTPDPKATPLPKATPVSEGTPGTPAPEATPAPKAGTPLKEAPVTAVTPVTPANPATPAHPDASATPEARTTSTTSTTPAASAAPAHDAAGQLLPHDEGDQLGRRLHHAVAGFVDAPRASVEEADRVLEELAARLADAVTHRRHTLRTSWQDNGADGRAPSTDTEQLRLVLRDYRELADRMMRL
ncbi:hypothetical protein OIE75_11155 [Streptomyces sp. NBC_01723]|uniref:hypothetical protein n=1 Tax=unclassified Streptomyces TaxID=2593676 RepID=UPI002E3457C2|nr:hypothetical protein [Streptomyces sp. NBC_01723]